MTRIVPVILSGGSGTRLWPASRSMYPKQLLPLVGNETMLQQTALRVAGLESQADETLIVCNETHRFLVAEQMRAISRDARIILEPAGRNTAPAIALAALLAADEPGDSLLLVMPADHVIAGGESFRAAVNRGMSAANDGRLVTFGVVPTRAETGYGYIHAIADGDGPVPVRRFVEKPDAATAQHYVDGGEHFWNSGMFLFNARTYLEELRRHSKDIYSATTASMRSCRDGGDFIRPDADAFEACPSDSIDYAVMEKTDLATMVPLDCGWSDVGSWAALSEVGNPDGDGNSVTGDVLLQDCKNTFIQAESRLVAAVGLDDVVIVETKDSTLVARKSRSQDVKAIVDQLKASGREEAKLHRQVFRPWGSYDSLENQEGFQVKRLIVNPGAVLSLQKHARRAEHWVVVRGKARITKNDKEIDLGVNESAYIAIGDVHRIANPFDEPVHIIEVQCGDYLGEDDIVRLEDNYGRAGTTT
ncbi:MAG: mannose-1-phosphate guanylyltransferase/mannose-6-phosphate isomerase [Gammaproteobacteria bacterium]|nr:mannose-1-phosphate guanylyltransferase/mannose-6-phosphate isomerase [Gammaproteobacteria bacterium]